MKFEGGAQMTDKGMITEGIKRGYNIYVLTPENSEKLAVHDQDFFIVSNCRNFDRKVVANLSKNNVKYAYYHHDTFCLYRLFFPWTSKCLTRCPEFAYWNAVFRGAKLNIFLSPLHWQMHSEAFGDSIEPHVKVPSAIDVTKFYDKKEPRDQDTTSINTLIDFKGRDEVLGYARDHPDQKFEFAGEGTDVELPPNCSYKGPVIYTKLNDFLNKYRNYVELPRNPQPFNRSCAEAYLAGCKVTGNKLLGALTWDWFTSRDSVREHIASAPSEFWAAIEDVM